MFSSSDYDKLKKIMDESYENKELISRLLTSHQMTVSTISHEIRNPLTLIYSSLQLIESEHPEVTHFRYWANLRSDVEYMKSLLEELSLYNNSEQLNITSIDTSSFFRTIALSFAASIINTPIEFLSDIEDNLQTFHGDSLKLREAILNLLRNACDATYKNSYGSHHKPWIRLHVTCKDHMLEINISDNGCGILEEHLASIFEPFVTYKPAGTGLGLPIVSRIIKAHLGTIHVSSTPGILTTFSLTLPIKQN